MDSGVDRTISFGVTPSYRYEQITIKTLTYNITLKMIEVQRFQSFLKMCKSLFFQYC